MTDEGRLTDPNDGNDLRTIIPRLDDLQRKCRSVGSRNEEATEMETRIGSILKRLQPAETADPEVETEPIPYAALARELYAVERFFESNGFLSIAKEVAHVERTLESFAPSDERKTAPSPANTSPSERVSGPPSDDDDSEPAPSKWAVPKPLALVGLLFVIAIAVCVVIIVRYETASSRASAPTTPRPAPKPTSAPLRPSPTPSNAASKTPAPGAILAGAIGKARLALAEGDIDGAIDHLSTAALVDSNHATVLGTANQIVDLLVGRANAAVDGGLWEIADLTLARASRIATRFGLDTQPIRDAVRRYSKMARFKLVKPGDTDVIRASAGRRVTIFFNDESNRESIIKGVEGPFLLLNEDTTVRGGAVYYTDKVPLADIGFLKVWNE
jgi:hypothetical protein